MSASATYAAQLVYLSTEADRHRRDGALLHMLLSITESVKLAQDHSKNCQRAEANQALEPKKLWEAVQPHVGGHNGEYHWKCLKCGNVDWFAVYTDPNKEGIKCGKCHA